MNSIFDVFQNLVIAKGVGLNISTLLNFDCFNSQLNSDYLQRAHQIRIAVDRPVFSCFKLCICELSSGFFLFLKEYLFQRVQIYISV